MELDVGKLRRAREAQALTQAALALRCELSLKTVQRLERGATVRPETAATVAGALDMAVCDLVRGEARSDRSDPAGQLTLRRVRSGKHLLDQLARTDLARVDCDVDATGETIEALAGLIARLQGLTRDSWGQPRPAEVDPPLIERLRLVAELNDRLRALEAHGVGLFMGHYERYPLAMDEGGRPIPEARAARTPVVITQLHLTATDRERLAARIEGEWSGRPAAAGPDILTGEAEHLVLLYPSPPLAAAAADAATDWIDGDYAVVG